MQKGKKFGANMGKSAAAGAVVPTVKQQIKGNRKLKRAYKKAKQKQFDSIKKNYSKLSDEELMKLRKDSPVKYAQILAAIAKAAKVAGKVVAKGAKVAGKAVAKGAKAVGKGAKVAGKKIATGAGKASKFAQSAKGKKIIGAAQQGAGIISSAQQPTSFSSPASNFKQMNFSGAGSPFNMKRTAKTFDFGSKKPQNKRDYTAKEERDFSPHNISARRTEGTIKQQAKLRAARGKK
jgi:hypothetical protein